MKKISGWRPDSRQSLRGGWPSWKWLVPRVMATLGFAVFALSPAVLSQTQMETPRSTILVFNYSPASAMTIRIAEAKASQILGKAGFPAVWVNCPQPSLIKLAACEKEQAPGEVRVRILAAPTKHMFQDSVFGFTIPPVFASVYYESALHLAKIDNAEFEAPAILGCVIAHEIGHLLLGPNRHTAIGIMQPRWGNNQVRQIMRGELVFTEGQSELIKAEGRRRMKDRRLVHWPLGAFGQMGY